MMTYDSKHHHRRSTRLRGYDYTQPGAYFITIHAYIADNLRRWTADLYHPDQTG